MLEIPNHTQVPNAFIETVLKDLGGAAVKVFLCICRKTIGWHKLTDRVSYSQLVELTGLSRRTVGVGLKNLLEAGQIKAVKEAGRTTLYEINFQHQGKNCPSTRAKSSLDQGNNYPSTRAKITLTKETSKKTSKKQCVYSDVFQRFWEKYPRKVNKGGAFKCWNARLKEGIAVTELMGCLGNYARAVVGKEEKYILHASTFLNADHRFRDYAKTTDETVKYGRRCPECGSDYWMDGRLIHTGSCSRGGLGYLKELEK